MRLEEESKERLRNLTAELLLEVRAAHLRSGQANALKHWDQLQDRVRAAARTSVSVEGFATEMARSMRVGAPSVAHAAAVRALADEVRELGARPNQPSSAAFLWLDLVEEEWGYLIALTRGMAEKRKETTDTDASNAVV